MKKFALLSLAAAAAGTASAGVVVQVGDTDSSRAAGKVDSGRCDGEGMETITTWAECQTAVLEGLQMEYRAQTDGNNVRMLRQGSSQVQTQEHTQTVTVEQSDETSGPRKNFWKASRSTAEETVECSGSGNKQETFASASNFHEDSSISSGGCNGDDQRATFGYSGRKVIFTVATNGFREGHTAQVSLTPWSSGSTGNACNLMVDASPDCQDWHNDVATFGKYTGFGQAPEDPRPTFRIPFSSDASNSLCLRYRHEGQCSALVYVREAGARIARADREQTEYQIELEDEQEEEREQQLAEKEARREEKEARREEKEARREEKEARREEKEAQRKEKQRIKALKNAVKGFVTDSGINAKVRPSQNSGRPYGCIKQVTGRKAKYFFNSAEDMEAAATNDHHVVCQASQDN